MYAMIADRVAKRSEKHTTVVCDDFPLLKDTHETCWLGSFSRVGVSSKTRWIKRSAAILIGGHFATPSEIARDYIATKYPKRLRASRAQLAEIMRHRSHPLYAEPVTIDNGVYVDVKSAYWSILSLVGWDCDYFPGRFLGIGQGMDDFPFSGHKMTRNCLVTAGLPGTARMWKYPEGKIVVSKRGNPHPNTGIWAIAQDILHGVAIDVVFAGAQYVHTDGYICSANRLLDVTDAIEGWGLPWAIKYVGNATIFGPGIYSIGDKISRRRTIKHENFSSIYQMEYHQWLRTKIQWAAKQKTSLGVSASPASHTMS